MARIRNLRENAGMDIFRIFHLQCARRLPALPDTHPCSRLHGHSFRIELTVSGEVDPALGWVLDFADIEAAWRPVYTLLDHRYLNELEPFTEINPTAENIAAYFYRELVQTLNNERVRVSSVTLWETDRACVRYAEEVAP